jgi:hypothetical protein
VPVLPTSWNPQEPVRRVSEPKKVIDLEDFYADETVYGVAIGADLDYDTSSSSDDVSSDESSESD